LKEKTARALRHPRRFLLRERGKRAPRRLATEIFQFPLETHVAFIILVSAPPFPPLRRRYRSSDRKPEGHLPEPGRLTKFVRRSFFINWV
jgi:hypothetical protein